MLSITTKSPYAVRALAELARCGGTAPVPIGELAKRRNIPVQFLEQLFAVAAARGHPQVPARRQGRLHVRPRPVRGHRPRGRRAARRPTRRRRRVDLRRRRRSRPRRPPERHDRRRGREREPRRGRADVLHLGRSIDRAALDGRHRGGVRCSHHCERSQSVQTAQRGPGTMGQAPRGAARDCRRARAPPERGEGAAHQPRAHGSQGSDGARDVVACPGNRARGRPAGVNVLPCAFSPSSSSPASRARGRSTFRLRVSRCTSWLTKPRKSRRLYTSRSRACARRGGA